MAHEAQQREAAQALSDILKSNGIKHAIIGGYAVHLLGHNRKTDDVDVYLDIAVEMRDQLTQLLMQNDSRFVVEHRKLFFTPTNSGNKIPLETLPIGQLGLPRQLRVMQLEHSQHLSCILTLLNLESDFPLATIPVLHPAVLILTKIKRCVQFIGSTRPQSVRKFRSDVSDIQSLLNWLVRRNEKIDFVGYHSATVDRLYKAVTDLLNY
ncbi:hypothetical protein AAE478_005055 [Parahypoxylon ruwenzoriense]